MAKAKAKPKMLFSIVYQVQFEPNTALYKSKDPKKMAAAAEKDANETPLAAFLSMAHHHGGKYRVKVTPLESTEETTGLLVKG
jgi:hypothetical protein